MCGLETVETSPFVEGAAYPRLQVRGYPVCERYWHTDTENKVVTLHSPRDTFVMPLPQESNLVRIRSLTSDCEVQVSPRFA